VTAPVLGYYRAAVGETGEISISEHVLTLQLYMASVMKPHILEKHDFYVTQIKERVLAQLKDLEGDADRYAKIQYQRLIEIPGDDNTDMADLAEMAHERAVSHYELLSDLKEQVILGALAGLYHQWEKELRDFIERELMDGVEAEQASKRAWCGSIMDIFRLLTDFGWDVHGEPFFPKINACRLIVNVHKHGNGPSLDDLRSKYPDYLRDPFGKPLSDPFSDYVNYDWLTISEQNFNEIACALRAFWVEFPERLYKDRL
jgi:hypothetical protein